MLQEPLDDHVTNLNDVLQNDPESAECTRIVHKVAVHLAESTHNTLSLCA
jgi:hypothetical protein